MRDNVRASGTTVPESTEIVTARYEALLDDGMRAAAEFVDAPKAMRAKLAKVCDRLFAERVAVLQRMPMFPTLDERMPALQAIRARAATEAAAWNAERIGQAFRFDVDRMLPTMEEATEAQRRVAQDAVPQLRLTAAETQEFMQARRKVLEEIGCQFVFPELRAAYTNMLSFVKDDLVVHLTQDALPTAGLPAARRISGIMLSTYKDGHAQEHIAAYAHGRWDTRVTDRRAQHVVDEITAAVG